MARSALTFTLTPATAPSLALTPTPNSTGGTLRASDSELLLQYLLSPYLRVPLLLRFFSEASHTAALSQPELQA